jgi:hypothetical protein
MSRTLHDPNDSSEGTHGLTDRSQACQDGFAQVSYLL